MRNLAQAPATHSAQMAKFLRNHSPAHLGQWAIGCRSGPSVLGARTDAQKAERRLPQNGLERLAACPGRTALELGHGLLRGGQTKLNPTIAQK